MINLIIWSWDQFDIHVLTKLVLSKKHHSFLCHTSPRDLPPVTSQGSQHICLGTYIQQMGLVRHDTNTNLVFSGTNIHKAETKILTSLPQEMQ